MKLLLTCLLLILLSVFTKQQHQHLQQKDRTQILAQIANKAQTDSFYTDLDDSEYLWLPERVVITENDLMNPLIVMCRMHIGKYHRSPHQFPMYKHLSGASNCRKRENQKVGRLNDILVEAEQKKIIQPSGFVFHESRVGSTLIANMLASNPKNLVFSESPAITTPLSKCKKCTEEQSHTLFKKVVKLMGVSSYHTHLYFKLQTNINKWLDFILTEYPQSGFIYVFRDPVEVMMSQFASGVQGRPGSALCVRHRGKANDIPIVKYTTKITGKSEKFLSNPEYCAGFLAFHNSLALDALSKYAYREGKEGKELRGISVNYANLPGILPKLVIQHAFKQEMNEEWLLAMTKEQNYYSKSKDGHDQGFETDNTKKLMKSTEEIREASFSILQGVTNDLDRLGKEHISFALDQNENLALKEKVTVKKNIGQLPQTLEEVY